MLKKSLICTFIMIILSLCCTMCFAAENGNNINLGNEIMRSIDKTENSMKNVVSGNVINDAGNMMQEGANTIRGGMNDVENGTRDMVDGNNYNMNDMDNRNNNEENAAGVNNGSGYNTTRTSADQMLNNGINTMTATTWMWIILIVAAVTIMAAIWYYATQGNK